MSHFNGFIQRALVGAAAGTAAILIAETLIAKFAPQSLPRSYQEPDDFAVEQAEKAQPEEMDVPRPVEKAAIAASHFFYGATFGAIYAILRPEAEHPVLEGTLFGTADGGLGGWLYGLASGRL